MQSHDTSKMVENSEVTKLEVGLENALSARVNAHLEGTKLPACILVATKGALVVKVNVENIIYEGVLLEVSSSRYLNLYI